MTMTVWTPAVGQRTGHAADPGDLRRRAVHPRRRRAPRRGGLRRRCARPRSGASRPASRAATTRPVSPSRCSRPATSIRRRRSATASPRSSTSPGCRRRPPGPACIGFCLGGTLAFGRGRRRRPGGVRQLLRVRRARHDRPHPRRLVPDAVPLRCRRRVHPGRRRRGARRGDPGRDGPQRRGRRPRLRQPRGRHVLERGGRQGRLVQDDGLPRRAPPGRSPRDLRGPDGARRRPYDGSESARRRCTDDRATVSRTGRGARRRPVRGR